MEELLQIYITWAWNKKIPFVNIEYLLNTILNNLGVD